MKNETNVIRIIDTFLDAMRSLDVASVVMVGQRGTKETIVMANVPDEDIKTHLREAADGFDSAKVKAL